jgi:hypothetical protein
VTGEAGTSRRSQRERSPALGVALLAAGDRELRLEVRVLLAQSPVLGAQRLKTPAQRGFGGALPGGDAAGFGGGAVAQPLDRASERGLRVEPLA